MPEQPEINFLWYVGMIVLGLMFLGGCVGTYLVRRHEKLKEERFRPTHRRTYPKV